jgi:hypothetical protein
MPMNSPSAQRLGWALAAVCVLGAYLRSAALTYGLPGIYNPDEIPILSRALALAKGDPNPHNFLYPSLHFYLLFLWEAAFFLVGWVAGLFSSLAEFQASFFRDPSSLVLAGRALTAVCGTITLFAAYRLGEALFDRATGVAAALLLAVSPFAVQDAHYIKLDVPVTMFTAFAHVAIARLVVRGDLAARRGAWIWAGLLAGLAISTQYYVVFIVLTIAAAALADVRRAGAHRAIGNLSWAAAGTVAGFLIGTPFIIVEMDTALRDIGGVREVDIDRALEGGGGLFTSLPAYLRMLGVDAMGWPVALAATAGLVVLFATDWRRAVVLATFPLAYLTFIAHTVPMSRYVDCMLPVLCVAGAFALVAAGRRIAPSTPALTAGLVTLAAIPGAVASVHSNQFHMQTDTRTLAREFIEREIPSGASILTQPYSAPIARSRDALLEALTTNLGDAAQASIKFQLELQIDPPLTPSYRTIYFGDGGSDVDKLYVLTGEIPPGGDLGPLRRRGIAYVILKRSNVQNPKTVGIETALARDATRLATFEPYRADADAATRARVPPFLHNTGLRIDPALERPGPIVDIWRLR